MEISEDTNFLKGLSHLGDQPQRSGNARKNQPNAGEPSLDHRYAIARCV